MEREDDAGLHEGMNRDIEPLRELSEIVGGRVDGVSVNPDTGLIALSIHAGDKRVMGAGIGPDVAGIGWLPRLPRVRAGSLHPLVAAIRAHLVGHRVKDAGKDGEGAVWIVVAGPLDGIARLALVPDRRGEARVYAASGELVMRWPPGNLSNANRIGNSVTPISLFAVTDFVSAGVALVEESDRLALQRTKAALSRAVKARIAAALRRVAAVRGDLARLGDVDRLQRIGRLLLAQGSRVSRGASIATLDDWEVGGTIEVALDPALPAKAQAEAFFAKARRYQRGEVIMRRRLNEAEQKLTELRELASLIAASPAEITPIEALSAQARSLGISESKIAPLPSEAGRAARSGERLPFTLYRSAGGSPILVGRGAKDNDALTTKHARPHDLWLHAKGMHGAHVVVPLQKGTSCAPDVLVDAATLAAHFSDARSEAVCEVSYVEKRYVRKPKKSSPGAVIYEREKVIAVRIEPGRLERLLETKEKAQVGGATR